MAKAELRGPDELYKSITAALTLADRLELPLVAIRLDEARSLLAPKPQDALITATLA